VLLLARELGAGGSERQLTELAKAIDKTRFDVHVGYFREGIRCPELTGIRTLKMDITSFRKREAMEQALRLGKYFRSYGIQIVHTFDYPLTCFAVPVARAFGVPVVLSSQRGSRSLIPRLYRGLVRATDQLVNGVVVNCRAMESQLVQEEDLPRRKVYLCYNGIDTVQYSPAPFRRESRQGRFTIGCVSVLRPEKNLGLLVKAVARLSTAFNDIRLLIVGYGPEEKRLGELARRYQLEDRFELWPVQRDVIPALREMDVFVLPSETEALSNSLMEAMACGCAAIASKVGGNPELIQHERTGLLFKSGNVVDLTVQLERLVTNDLLRAQLGQKGREFIEGRFSMGDAARRMEHIYGRLAGLEQS
jgi:glycosyltransferase involved in cell wall biosynthesis